MELTVLKEYKTVAKDSGYVESDPNQIVRQIEFICEWSELASFNGPHLSKTKIQVTLDPEELEPTHLRVKGIDSDLESLKSISLRVDLFGFHYDLSCELIEIDIHSKIAYVSMPLSIHISRLRRISRIKSRRTVSCKRQTDKSIVDLVTKEIGPGGIVVERDSNVTVGDSLVLGGIDCRIEKMIDRDTHLFLKIEQSDKCFGAIWDLYMKERYPFLEKYSPKTHSKERENLFFRSGYYENFSLSDSEHTSSNSDFEDKYTYIIPGDEKIQGSSSFSPAFLIDEQEAWVFHELSADTSPEILIESGALYLWRAENAFSNRRVSSTHGWFRSKSRWLERIYTKLQHTVGGGIELIRSNRLFKANVDLSDLQLKLSGFKKTSLANGRVVFNGPGFFSGIHPNNLNIGGLLNHIFIEECSEELKKILDNIKTGSSPLFVSIPNDIEEPLPKFGEIQPSDLYFNIPSDFLPDLLSVVEHSIALTRRKYGKI